MKKFTKLAMAAAVLGATSFGAVAAPVTEFFFSQSAGIVNPTIDGSGPTYFAQTANGLYLQSASLISDSQYPSGTATTISWSGGDASVQSSLAVNSFTSDTTPIKISGNGDSHWEENEAWVITKLHHHNEVLYATSAGFTDPLWVADILANLRIFSDLVGGTLIHDELGSQTRISFNETINQAPCGEPNPNSSTCDDVYSMLLGSLEPTFFFYDGTQYELLFGLVPGAGAAVVPGDPLRVFTAEGGDSDVYVTMAWRAVPEPGSLALAGLGLSALAALRRRKNMPV